jgi:acetyl esterase/lipase
MKLMQLPARLVALLVLLTPALASAEAPKFTRTQDIIYGRKFGTALTFDVFKPEKPNGRGVIFIVSGGWFSSHDSINPGFFTPVLEHGYTVFAVVHGSQPRFIIPECQSDLHRAVRFIRHNSKDYGIDPDHIGVYGASAGGHLTLSLVTQGGPGDPKAKDPVDRDSSAVQAAVAFFPPTDFLNYGKPGEDAVGVGILKDFKAAFGPAADTPDSRQTYGRQISPIYHVHADMAPTLIIHGDADKLVPIQQAQSFIEKCKQLNTPAKLITKPGKGHGWSDIGNDLKDVAEWFDQNLSQSK